jgi:hypothetical protein
VALAIGCGGKDDGLAKAELIKRGDAVCAAANDRSGEVFSKLFPNGDETPPAAQAAPLMAQVEFITTSAYRDLHALDARAGDEAGYAKVLDRYHALASAIQRSAKLAAAGDTEGYLQQMQHANEAYAAIGRPAKAFGFRSCGAE